MGNQRDTAPAAPEAAPRIPFFRKCDWAAFWLGTLVTMAVYCYTMAPTVTLEDSGELATGGAFMGVPHPPGYPIWALISWIFSRIFSFVHFRGQPDPAWSIALVSVVFGALAAGISAMLVCRSGSDLLRLSRDALHKADHRFDDAVCCCAGVAGSLLFAFSPVEWSQSTIVEVYSLNAFFLALVFLLTYWWMSAPSDRLLWITAFVFGLGLTNYQVLLLAMAPLVVAILLRDMPLFRGFIIAGAPLLIIIGGMDMDWLPFISHPLAADCFTYLALNLLVITLVYFFLPRGRTIALTILLAELGVAFYAYMPLVSDLRNPPMNWGFPRTWEGFQHAITRGQYEKIVPTDIFSWSFIQQIGEYFTDLREQYTLPLALLGFLPFAVWRVRIGKRVINAFNIAAVLAILAVIALVLEHALPGPMGRDTQRLDKLFVAGVMLMLGVGGITLLTQRGWELWDKLVGRSSRDLADRITIGAIGLVGLFVYAFYVKNIAAKIHEILAPLHSADAATAAQGGMAMMQAISLVGLILAPLALTAATAWLIRSKYELRLTIDEKSQKWVVATLLGFLVMSFVLLALASPKGDVQDAFIQRVKFISSHALFAFWIGYGLIFGLAWADTIFKGNRLMRTLGLTVTMLLPLCPILVNGYNSELIRLSGGSEQNGHDFGWQFGNYELRGAEAITEELAPDEEPIPNPAYPPPMGTNAIFYGGTDPGRFVPTYMIYCARVREDVYLITQNALADNTYMNVMRDLYGDQIWIPATQDSANAFRVYVEEVQSGKRKPQAELQIENGRVQVSGALGVMEINGILAQMIFDRNKWRHDFYVEESYVLKWMYPYLTPHGLIMKINADETPLTPENVRDDMDFWDWYTRRLHSNIKFQRDVVARKSFSKLRSAIGGLYANRGLMRNAEEAFHEARVLYPLSPEANFRLVQEVLLPQGRFEDSRKIMEEYATWDPGNDRVPEFLAQLVRIQQLDEKIHTLEQRRQSGVMDAAAAFELASAYLQAMQTQRFTEIIDGIMATTNLPPQYCYQAATLLYSAKDYPRMDKALDRCVAGTPPNSLPAEISLNMARMYADAQMPQKMVTSLQRYLQAKPDDWKAWLDLSYIFLTVHDTNAAEKALQAARQYGGADADALIQQDNRFAPLLQGASAGAGMNLLDLPGSTTP